MIERYSNPQIAETFSDAHRLNLWQDTELAVIQAMVKLNMIPTSVYESINKILKDNPIDLAWQKKREEDTKHDLNAFLDERLRWLNQELQRYFHDGITSYDTEESAFARMLLEALGILRLMEDNLENILVNTALKHRYCVMMVRTHGQLAELKSFGARALSWLAEYRVARQALRLATENLRYSKLAGAVGNYGSFDPAIEAEALAILGFVPFYGATQIMPRVLYAPVAQAISNLIAVVSKIAHDIRLAARSSRPLMQEPFGDQQKGSSAMPHKKNTVQTEQLEGMARMAKGYMLMITENIVTDEERSIEQSCVERVAWSDILHVATRSLKVITNVLTGLKVYPDNMLWDIQESRGTYASAAVKEFLKKEMSGSGLSYEDIYRLVQLACFNIFEPSQDTLVLRNNIPKAPTEMDEAVWLAHQTKVEKVSGLQDIIPQAQLRPSTNLSISQKQIDGYNAALRVLFRQDGIKAAWDKLFLPSFLMRHEATLYAKIVNV